MLLHTSRVHLVPALRNQRYSVTESWATVVVETTAEDILLAPRELLLQDHRKPESMMSPRLTTKVATFWVFIVLVVLGSS